MLEHGVRNKLSLDKSFLLEANREMVHQVTATIMEFAQTKLDSANAKTSCSLALGVSTNGPVTPCKSMCVMRVSLVH